MAGHVVKHIPVMAEAALDYLAIRPEGLYVDCTAGAGGHSAKIAEKLAPQGRLIAVDRDAKAVALASRRLEAFSNAQVYHRNYGELADLLADLEVSGVDGVLLDAGFSSMQLDEVDRGFSFQNDGPLDMRMDRSQVVDARTFLAQSTEKELISVLRDFGDVGPARRVAQSIRRRCDAGRMDRTGDLVEAVKEALPFVQGEPAEIRTVFQAIRMAVNEELHWLALGLEQALALLKPQGRLVVITFHSGEDRVAKTVLKRLSRVQRRFSPDGRMESMRPAQIKLLTKSPILPGEAETLANPRAKSAKLRAGERLA